jgi:DNA-binding NarL/FixJ family response regulator
MSQSAARPDHVRVLIADGADLVRRGIREVLADNGRFSVVGDFSRISDVAAACQELLPDIVFLGMGRDSEERVTPADALAALWRVLTVCPFAHVIVLMDGKAGEDVVRVLRAGASGALLRGASAAAVLKAVEDVLDGDVALDPGLARALSDYLAAQGGLPLSAGSDVDLRFDATALAALSPRERDVLKSLAQGHRNKEIASELGMSVGTVKTHLRHIFRKLEVSDRTAAVLVALQVRLPEAA